MLAGENGEFGLLGRTLFPVTGDAEIKLVLQGGGFTGARAGG